MKALINKTESEDPINYLEVDFLYTRSNIISQIENLKEVITAMKTIVMDADHHKVFETYATIAKTMSDLQQKLIDLHYGKKKVSGALGKKEEPKRENITNNTLNFSGSTADLQEIINNMSINNNIIDV